MEKRTRNRLFVVLGMVVALHRLLHGADPDSIDLLADELAELTITSATKYS